MAKKKKRRHSAGTIPAAARRQQSEPDAIGTFPPLSISLEGLVQNGSDRAFRRLIYDLISFSAQMLRHRDHYAAYIGVTGPQYSMMTLVAENRSMTVGQLAQQMHVSSQFVTVEIGKLIKKNIVERRPNEADRRSMFLNLTSKGQNLLRELGPLRRWSNDIMYRSLTKERARVLQDIITNLNQDAKSALHELGAPRLHAKKAPAVQSLPGRDS